MPRALEASPDPALAASRTLPQQCTARRCGGSRLPRPIGAPSSSKDRTTWQQVAGSLTGRLDGLVRSSASVLGLAACDVKMWDAVFKGFWSVEGLKKKKRWIGQKRGKMLTCNMYFYYTFLKNRVMVKLLKTLTFFLNRNPYLTVLAFIKFCSLVPGSFI